MDKRSALENLDLVFMTLDELVDGGCAQHIASCAACTRWAHTHSRRAAPPRADRCVARHPRPFPAALRGSIILETDASVIAGRVSMRGGDGELPLSEQTFSQALASAKEQLARSLLS